MNEKQQNIQIANDEIIDLFVPLEIKKRGGSAIIILPKNLKKEAYLNKSRKVQIPENSNI